MADITSALICQKCEHSPLLFWETDFHCTVQEQGVVITMRKGFAHISNPRVELTSCFMFPLLEFM